MIAFEWPFMHRTIAEVDDAGEWPDRYGRVRRAPHNQPAPRRQQNGGEAEAGEKSIHNGGDK